MNCEAVADAQLESRVVERAAVHALQMLARDVDDRQIDLAKRHRLDRRVLEQLLGRTAVAATDDQRALRRRMRQRGHVDEVLVIEELVLLARHELAVEAEQLAERHAVVHLDRLVRRAEALELAGAADEEAPVVGQVLGHRARREIATRAAVAVGSRRLGGLRIGFVVSHPRALPQAARRSARGA